MVTCPKRWPMPVALCAAACAATAQPLPSIAAKPHPWDASASVPAATYQSAFERYRRGTPGNAVPWRDASDTVARIGGWRAYARDAQQPEPAASVPGALPFPSDPQVAPHGHGGHKTP